MCQSIFQKKVLLPNSYTQEESVNLCSVAFNNQNCAPDKDKFAGMCVPTSPAFRNSFVGGPTRFIIRTTPYEG